MTLKICIMKKLYTLCLILLVAGAASAQPYYLYTAQKNGNWNDVTVWNMVPRGNGATKSKVVIPAAFTITVDNGVNSFGLGNVEVQLMGTLSVLPNTTVNLTAASTFEILGAGKITGTTSTQRITIGSVTKYNGALDGTKSGASIATAATGTSPNGFYAASLLAVKFSNFSAIATSNGVNLKWSTASEQDNAYFEVQRSTNGSSWTSIAKINGAGSTASVSNYSYNDNAATQTVYYRLKQVDVDGVAEYSVVKSIRGGKSVEVKTYASGGSVNVEMNTEVKEQVTITVMNNNGQVVARKQFSSGYKMTVAIPASASAQLLIVNVSDNNQLNQSSKIFL